MLRRLRGVRISTGSLMPLKGFETMVASFVIKQVVFNRPFNRYAGTAIGQQLCLVLLPSRWLAPRGLQGSLLRSTSAGLSLGFKFGTLRGSASFSTTC